MVPMEHTGHLKSMQTLNGNDKLEAFADATDGIDLGEFVTADSETVTV